MIKFDDVSKQFPLGNIALKNVSFEIKYHEFVFFVGPSGAGKTTILKIILHQYSPTSGSVVVDDFNVSDKHFKHVEHLRKKVGVVFQDFKILPDKNIYENIALSLKVSGASPQTIKKEIEEALHLVNLPQKIS